MLLRSNSSNGEEGIENSLVKSMNESKVAKKKLEQFITKSHQELNKSGYEVGLSYLDQKITIQVQDKAFLEANKTNIEKIIHSTAREVGFQDFKVDFLTSDSYSTITEENQKFSESMMTAYEEISSLLKKNEYDYHSMSMSISPNNDIIVEIQRTNIGNKEIEEPIAQKIEELIAQKMLSNSNTNLEVKFKEIGSTLLDQEWQPIFEAIRVETEKKFEEYKGFAYSFHPEPLQIIIKTDLDTPKWFRNSNRKANQMKKYVHKIINLKQEELSIKEIPYEIIVEDKNTKKIK